MVKKRTDDPPAGAAALTHSPFAQLANRLDRSLLPAPEKAPAPAVARKQAAPPARVRMHQESKGRSGKVVTRVSGLPQHNLEAISSRLRQALGCGAVVEGADLLLLGSLAERAQRWLDAAGDLRDIRDEPKPRPAAPPPELSPVGSAGGTKRSDVRPGQRVAIVQKADQTSGALTEGVVRDILTSSPTHPRGIKVRLETGEVGRVKITFG